MIQLEIGPYLECSSKGDKRFSVKWKMVDQLKIIIKHLKFLKVESLDYLAKI